MKPNLTLLVLLILTQSLPALGAGMRQPSTTPARVALAPGDEVPNVVAEKENGEEVTVDYAGARAHLVNFWMTGCVPCGQMLEALEQLRDKHAGDGLEITSVYLDPKANQAAIEAATAAQAKFPILHAKLIEADVIWGGLRMMPVTFLVDAKGKLVRRYVGAAPEQRVGLQTDVDAFLAGKPLPMQVIPAIENNATGTTALP